jgi:hypothetical protein
MDKTSDPEADKAQVASKERSESQAQKSAENSEAQEASEDGASVPEGDEASQKPNPSPKSGGRANRRSESSGAEGDENKSASRERGDPHSQKTNLNNLIVKFLPPSMNSVSLYVACVSLPSILFHTFLDYFRVFLYYFLFPAL